ncbi:hypothetical protein OG921_26325 [Aldersonia sp. NBC_00410]|uniref:hypothetical protein n=1 Tax=Aldersonia sp. NBC_00410 TaxID=2975954 RepID=UPI00224D3033|nr:hypothetical protein [Aldersonia sp. NBC_00410]MCX5046696.1 hypothetical protein [Aldersonia sp. NBC_00410]
MSGFDSRATNFGDQWGFGPDSRGVEVARTDVELAAAPLPGVPVSTVGVPTPPVATELDALVAVLCGFAHRGADEYAIQESVQRALHAQGVRFEREVRLSATDRVDFLVSGAIAVEVKTAGKQLRVVRQLQRYAGHGRVAAVVLASTRIALVAGLPRVLAGKPVVGVVLPGGVL